MNIKKSIIPIILLGLVSIGIAYVKFKQLDPLTQSKFVLPSNFPQGYQIGSWLWESPDAMDAKKREELFSFSKEEGITTIYLNVSNVIDAMELPEKEASTQAVATFENSLKEFITEAKTQGINVEALGGDINWARDSHEYIPKMLLNYVLDYNKRNPDAAFSGIQYDVEFYGQETYFEETTDMTREYLILLETLGTMLKDHQSGPNTNLKIGFDIAYWLDNENETGLLVEWKGKNAPPFNHIADELNAIPNSYLVVMAYRNKAGGEKGSSEVVRDEVDYIANHAKNIQLFIGQETDKNKITHITFSGSSRNAVKNAVNQIADAYKDTSAVKGFAIHHLLSYKQMDE